MSTCREALGHSMLFGALDDEVLDALAAASVARRYAKGQIIADEGEPGGDVLIVAEGRVKVIVRSRDGVEIVLTVAGAGDTLGELSVFDEAPRSASIEAAEASQVVTVPGHSVRRVVQAGPDFAAEIIRQQADMLRRSTGMVADLIFLDLPRRVAKFVVQRARSDGTVDLGLSQAEIAAAVGGVRQSVNAALRGFERRGWLSAQGRTIQVLDHVALARYANLDTP